MESICFQHWETFQVVDRPNVKGERDRKEKKWKTIWAKYWGPLKSPCPWLYTFISYEQWNILATSRWKHEHLSTLSPLPPPQTRYLCCFLCKRMQSSFSQSYSALLETLEASLTIPSDGYQVLVCIYRTPYPSYISPLSISKPILKVKPLIPLTKLLTNLPESEVFQATPVYRMLIDNFLQITTLIVSLSCSKPLNVFLPPDLFNTNISVCI